jgi:predicted SPOUT superfamily RNA methylase MTH1
MISKSEVSVLLPASLTADVQDLRQKTIRVGMVGRALAVFRVGRVCIYADDDPNVKNQSAEAELIATLLRYMETPQYLRKLLLPRTEELRYAGLLPPLRTPHHPLKGERTRPGDHREGVVIKSGINQSLLEIGLPEKAVVGERLRVGLRLTVRLGEKYGNRVTATPVNRTEISEYWGYEVLRAGSLSEGLKALGADLCIGTSRRGRDLRAVQAMEREKLRSVAVAFGGPYAGLFEICERQGVDAGELFDVMINTVPNQGTQTVRTEEALLATLAVLNALNGG